jgi:hypothetical protein
MRTMADTAVIDEPGIARPEADDPAEARAQSERVLALAADWARTNGPTPPELAGQVAARISQHA